MQIRPGLHRIQAPLGERFIAMYLLEGPAGAVLFDTGVAESVPGTLLPYLEQIGFNLSRLRWVVSSHCDFDHTGGNAALAAAAPHVEFLAGAADVAMTEDVETLIRGRYGEFADDDGFDDPAETTALVRASTALVAVDRALHGGERFDLGDRVVHVLAVPGHSPGHLALWDPRNRALVISDAVLGVTVPTAEGDPAFPPTYRDTNAYVESIAALRALDAELLLTAHYPVYEGEAVAAFLDESLGYTLRIDTVIEAALRAAAAPLTTLDVIDRTHAELGPWGEGAREYLIFPMTGNLERFVEAGSVAVGRRDGRRTWEWVR
ncbi:MBL fold metallo-hydrolase [Microbacterium telephonicum]|uniref:Glyoxylase-like metal-dependent hydrolase (Beta-lactamase superfamily II) n=1 Tax=Microbacterium telephonicum TaxID=1714841 RepID=A0A498C159_9MICO|nr:MBL fold metallo-hydrolase [Microbacterium telephonicum]RLK46598.1 glyoxylase-like metal-dependent hydrolase (beta-lactamase superfamily II) [Microbacterium telephonicum]